MPTFRKSVVVEEHSRRHPTGISHLVSEAPISLPPSTEPKKYILALVQGFRQQVCRNCSSVLYARSIRELATLWGWSA
jgi:hypothetical protein